MDEFEKIYSENVDHVYNFLYNMCSDGNLAEELTSETFYQAFLSFRKFKGNSKIFTWLASIAKFTYYKYLKKNKNRLKESSIETISDENMPDSPDRPDEIIMLNETRASVKERINKLPAKYRDVVFLRMYAELPFSEIAISLNISENSAKVIYCRAKKMLSEELKNEYYM